MEITNDSDNAETVRDGVTRTQKKSAKHDTKDTTKRYSDDQRELLSLISFGVGPSQQFNLFDESFQNIAFFGLKPLLSC